ncbi:MAG: hypothetical protein ACR2PO_18980 [Methyloligellaceae bacterium]
MLTRAPGQRPARLLVTGFGPFPGVRDNPTERLIQRIRADPTRHRSSGFDMRTAVLPTEWSAVRARVPKLLARHDPDVILHFGVHGRAGGFQLEQRACNHMGMLPDACGQRGNGSAIVTGAPRMLRSMGPSERLVSHLRTAGLPAELSMDAGRYLCNMLLYLSLLHAHTADRPRTVQFVHIPPVAMPGQTRSGGMMTSSELDLGAAALIKACAALRTPRRHGSGRHGIKFAAE